MRFGWGQVEGDALADGDHGRAGLVDEDDVVGGGGVDVVLGSDLGVVEEDVDVDWGGGGGWDDDRAGGLVGAHDEGGGHVDAVDQDLLDGEVFGWGDDFGDFAGEGADGGGAWGDGASVLQLLADGRDVPADSVVLVGLDVWNSVHSLLVPESYPEESVGSAGVVCVQETSGT